MEQENNSQYNNFNLTIRPVSLSDINRLHYIENHSFKSPFSLEMLKKLAQIQNILYLVAEIKKFIIGYTICSLGSSEAHIISIVIDKSYRRKGFGSILLNKIISKIKIKKIKKIKLEVRVNNTAAIAFYSKFNFKTVKIREKYYSDGEDAFEMELNI